jgi:hypothetical protein
VLCFIMIRDINITTAEQLLIWKTLLKTPASIVLIIYYFLCVWRNKAGHILEAPSWRLQEGHDLFVLCCGMPMTHSFLCFLQDMLNVPLKTNMFKVQVSIILFVAVE